MINYIGRAIDIVEEAFAGKVDKGGEPYINHLRRVCARVLLNEECAVVAILHDLLEDCPEWDAERLLEHFPAEIVDAVLLLTRDKNESYDEYIKRLAMHDIARPVKVADLMDNMCMYRITAPLTERDIKRLKKYHEAYLYLVDYAVKKYGDDVQE